MSWMPVPTDLKSVISSSRSRPWHLAGDQLDKLVDVLGSDDILGRHRVAGLAEHALARVDDDARRCAGTSRDRSRAGRAAPCRPS